MAEGTGRGDLLSIWFFVGCLTLLYGIVLLPYGAWAWATGREAHTVLFQLHPTFWWVFFSPFLEASIQKSFGRGVKTE